MTYAIVMMFFYLLYSSIHFIPPDGITRSRMNGIKARIAKHLSTNLELPEDISSLPALSEKSNDTNDGWGRAITWSIKKSSQVTLYSYGKDGSVGGDGENTDIIRVIDLKTGTYVL